MHRFRTRRSVSRRNVIKTAALGAGALSAATLLGSRARSVAAAQRADTLTIALDAFTTEDWLVHSGGSNIGWGPPAPLYEYLLYYDPSDPFALTPGLAESWSSSDLKQWTFKLRPGVPWQRDQGEVTIDDIVNSLELLARDDAESPDTPYWRDRIGNMEVVGSDTITFSFDTVEADLAYQLSPWRITLMQPKDYLEEVGEDVARLNPVGSGPYRFASQSPGSEAVIEAVGDTHWRVDPMWNQMVFVNLPENSTRLAMLETDRADLVLITPEQLAEASEAGYTIYPNDVLTQFSIVLGGLFREGHPNYTGEEPWQDVRVREALNVAFDRQAINDTFFGGLGTYEWTPGNMLAPFEAMTDLAAPYDPERAASLIAEAGAGGAPIRIATYPYPGIPQAPQVLEAIAAYWEAAGLRPEIVPMDRLVMRDAWVADETNDTTFLWANPAAPTFQARFEKFFYSQDIGFQIYTDEHLDAEYERLRTMEDEQERMQLLTDAQHHTREQWGAVHILNVPQRLFAGRSTVGAWSPGFSSEYAFWEYIAPQ